MNRQNPLDILSAADKCCHVQVILPKLSDVAIEDTEVDLYIVIDRAVQHAGRTVGRRLARQRDNERFSAKQDMKMITE